MSFKDRLAKTVDNLKSGAADTASRALTSADRALKRSKVQEQIRQETVRLTEQYTTFGQRVYEHRGVLSEALEQFLTDADAHVKQLNHWKSELSQLENDGRAEPAVETVAVRNEQPPEDTLSDNTSSDETPSHPSS
ncbi:hypothetical protein D2Q93_10005 [Alicyclobacillaceae bacterium I2511]|jgi:hypothetical protein|nr:hypothetical protein D2Q93_10005 [Alicyclobacillaceae bacterium I2511]